MRGFALAFAGLLATEQASAQQAPLVRTAEGAVAGSVVEGVEQFLGIPYAAPPVGERRWRLPAPATRRTGTLDGTAIPAACPQHSSGPVLGLSPPPQSEDCLTLSLWRPPGARGAPIMVWVHGGSLVSGAGYSPITSGIGFAQNGVILIGINYRLGYLGFFAHPSLAREQGGSAVANFGLADQQAALRWVRRNAEALGGDPNNITLMGESAGARSVVAHLAAPASRGLFDKAVVQSAFHMRHLDTPERARQLGQQIAGALDLPADASATALRAVPVDRLVALQRQRGLDDLRLGLSLDALLPARPHDVVAAGRAAAVPLLIGYNSAEHTLMPGLALDPARVTARIRAAYPQLQVQLGDASPEAAGRQFFQDAWFAASTRALARGHARRAPTFLYLFDYRYQALESQRTGLGHAEDIPLVFNTLDRVPALQRIATDRDRAVARTAIACWSNFAKSGDPSGNGCPSWPAYRGDAVAMHLGQASAARPLDSAVRLDAVERASALGAR